MLSGQKFSGSNFDIYPYTDTFNFLDVKLRIQSDSHPVIRFLQNYFSRFRQNGYFGEHELALQVFREGMRPDATFIHPIWRPIHKGMRQLPEFKDFVREMGLVDYWRKSGKWGDFCRPVGNDDFVCD